MKHIAQIQSEFVKEARKWEDVPYKEQKEYLKRHPKSKKKLIARPERNKTLINYIYVADKHKKIISKIQHLAEVAKKRIMDDPERDEGSIQSVKNIKRIVKLVKQKKFPIAMEEYSILGFDAMSALDGEKFRRLLNAGSKTSVILNRLKNKQMAKKLNSTVKHFNKVYNKVLKETQNRKHDDIRSEKTKRQDDNEYLKSTLKDVKDVVHLKYMIKNNEISKAYNFLTKLDSVVQDEIPEDVFSYLEENSRKAEGGY